MKLLEAIYLDINKENAPRISKRRVKDHLLSHKKLAEVYNVSWKTLDKDLKNA